jgi:predicted transcriptional regulator
MSIHPRFAKAILSGEKKVEFRRRKFGRCVEFILVYATSPIQKVVGFFQIDRVAEASPSELWNEYRDRGYIREEAFLRYYKGRRTGVAIEVGKVTAFDVPIRLTEISEGISVPQSYCYVSRNQFDRAISFLHPSALA